MRLPRATMVMALAAGIAVCCSGADPSADAESSKALLQAVLKARQDVEVSTKELTGLQDSIAADRGPLADQLDGLQTEVKKLRQTAATMRRARDAGDEERRALATRVTALEEECRFAHSLLSEYRRSLETRVTRAEQQVLMNDLAQVDAALESDDRYGRLPEVLERTMKMGGRWHWEKLGGVIFEGTALDEKGVESPGSFAVLGPVMYFSCDKGRTAGIGMTRLGSSLVSVFTDIDEAEKKAICEVTSGRAATPPVDLTSGDALKIEGARTSLLEHLKKGGAVMIPLAVVGLVALGLILKKATEIRRFNVGPHPGVREAMRLLRDGNAEGAKSAVAGMGTPLSSVMRDIIEHSGSPQEYVEEVVHERILTHAHGLERHLGMIAVLGGVAPLLGLLGTVTGMIHTFKLVTIFGTGDARLLSGGISEALVTTQCGLVIAIPILLIHAYLLRRVRGMVTRLEETAAEAINSR